MEMTGLQGPQGLLVQTVLQGNQGLMALQGLMAQTVHQGLMAPQGLMALQVQTVAMGLLDRLGPQAQMPQSQPEVGGLRWRTAWSQTRGHAPTSL